ncbi:MAG: NAD(P)/FAD-dependent oxidoreductase [Anaerovoracaceae bacterium]|nr:NAD(P)/FAD-dependent oxidoreductase [Anaerovoracaceae bacterium]
MERHDIAIIGTGPAGVSAAVTATVRGKSVLLIGSGSGSEKLTKAAQVNNYPGFYGKSGAEIQRAFMDHLDAMGIKITEGKVGSVYDMGGYFSMSVGSDVMDADAVILAGGVVFGKPIEGENEFLGRGVSYCATCDGMLYRGRKAAVLAYDPGESSEADFLASIGVDVTYVKLYDGPAGVKEKMEVIEGVKPAAVEGGDSVTGVAMDDGSRIDADVAFVLRESIAPDKLIAGLELDGAHVKVDRRMRTNIDGLFAAGDITGTPYQYVKAAGEGNVAALSAVQYLDSRGGAG